jgi:hypothetical protein
MLSATITRRVTLRQFAAAAALAGCALDTAGAVVHRQIGFGAEAGGSVAAVLRLVR